MYTQTQRLIAIILLLSMTLQSCSSNFKLDCNEQQGAHQSSPKTGRLTLKPPRSGESKAKKPKPAIPSIPITDQAATPAAASSHFSPSLPLDNGALQPKAPSAQNYPQQTTIEAKQQRVQPKHSPTPEAWRSSLKDSINELAETNPQRASALSQRLLEYKGTKLQREALEELGVGLPPSSATPALRGGTHQGEPETKEETGKADAAPFDPETFLAVGSTLSSSASPEGPIDEMIRYINGGVEQAKQVEGQEAIVVLGNTGAGKSTFINCLAGRAMECLTLKELKKRTGISYSGVFGNVIIAQNEVTPIGHGGTSKTLMPKVITLPESDLICCDCPGFSDNRGPIINIANAVNIKRVLTAASRVKVVIMINYYSLLAKRAEALKDMVNVSTYLFGNEETLDSVVRN